MRRTSRTIRRLPSLARELARFGNQLDTMSRRAHKLSSQVADIEYLAGPVRDGKMRLVLTPCEKDGEFDPECDDCRTSWEDNSGAAAMARTLDKLPRESGR